MQRKINFYLIHEDNQFKLRAVQVERDKLFSNNRGHIDRAARARLEAPFSMPNYIWSQFARFNMLNLRDWNTGEVFRTYGLADNSETVIDQFHQNAAFFLIDRTYELKLGEKNLLMFLGCLDSAIHSYQHDLKDDKVENDGTFIEYCDTLPDFSNRFQLCHDALNKRMPPAKKGETRLSRHVASWMAAELGKMAETDENVLPILTLLNQFLSLTTVSLTPAIRTYLYPPVPLATLFERHCKGADELTKTLLDPAIDHTTKTGMLLEFVSNKLMLKTNLEKINKEDPDAVAAATKLKDDIHAEIEAWFETFERCRQIIWEKRIERLYGQYADDDGFYNKRYTEVSLLRKAKVVLNSQGLIQLHFLHTKSYKNNYKEGQLLFQILERELRLACSVLDLEFLPAQDMHVKAVFTVESSTELQNSGFHYSEAFCKQHFRNSMLKKQFMFNHGESGINRFSVLGRDLINTILAYVSADYYKMAEEKEQADKEKALEGSRGVQYRVIV